MGTQKQLVQAAVVESELNIDIMHSEINKLPQLLGQTQCNLQTWGEANSLEEAVSKAKHSGLCLLDEQLEEDVSNFQR